MAIRNIVKTKTDMAFLRKKSRPVDRFDEKLKILVDDMIETMHDANGAGLAAVQIGVLRRVFVAEYEKRKIVMVNPRVISSDGVLVDSEGCLSVANRSMLVPRPEVIEVEYQDIRGKTHRLRAEGYWARVLCHEMDHFDGILFTDKGIEEVKRENK